MRPVRRSALALLVLVAVLPGAWVACASFESEAPPGATDAGAADARATDAGPTDAGATDATAVDAGGTDASAPDAAVSPSPCADAGVDVLVDGGCATIVAADQPSPVFVLAADGYVFWTNEGVKNLVNGSLWRAAPDGGAPVAVVPEGRGKYPRALAAHDGYLYWAQLDFFAGATDIGGPATGGLLARRLVDGGGPEETFTDPGGGYAPRGVAVDEGVAYFVTVSGSTVRAALDGGTPSLIGAGAVNAISLAVDDAGIVTDQAGAGFGSSQPGAVFTMQLDGSGGKNIATGRGDYPWGLAIDATRVYWAERGDGGGNTASIGSVLTALRTGTGSPTTLCDDRPAPLFVFREGAYLYFTAEGKGDRNGTLNRVRVSNPVGNCETLVSGLAKPHGLFVDGTHVYWTTRGDGRVWRMPKP